MDTGRESYSEQETEPNITLSDEEIEFLRDEVGRIANKTIAEADWLFGHPELGMQEERSGKFLAKRLSHILGEKNVGEVGGGVYGILEGDQEDGATIFIRGDMDALPTREGGAAHMCGHNIHMAWLIENARLLSAYKDHYKELPFKRVVFIGEPNEEGTDLEKVGPKEMMDAGLFDKTGKPDLILGAHFAAPQVEGSVRIDKETATFSEGGLRYIITSEDGEQDVKSYQYELIYRIGKAFKGEDAASEFGRFRIVDDCQEVVPETIVRVTDSKLVGEERHLLAGVLNQQEEVELNFQKDLEIGKVQAVAKDLEESWGSDVKIDVTEQDPRSLKIAVKSKGGHTAFGGPNVKYIMAELLHNLKQEQSFSIKDGNQPLEIVGTIRSRAKDWQGESEEISHKLQEIVEEITQQAGGKIKIEGSPHLELPPVANDDRLRDEALDILEKAQIPITTVGMPMAVAETFAVWEGLGIPGLYLVIGGGDKEDLKKVKEEGLSVPERYLHHAPAVLDLIHANRAIPYGAVLSLVALEIGKRYNN